MSLIEQQRNMRRRENEIIPPLAQAEPGGSAGSGASFTVIKFDGERTDSQYTGHIWTDGGSQGAAVQFRFPNDTGVADLLNEDDYVLAVECPTWDEEHADWDGSDAKYWAILSPWGAFR